MEHILQFGINIDDDKIIKLIEEKGYDDIVNRLVAEAKKKLPKTSYYDSEIDWRRLVDNLLMDFIDENKDLIIDKAADKLVESYSRTKRFKEKMALSLEEALEND